MLCIVLHFEYIFALSLYIYYVYIYMLVWCGVVWCGPLDPYDGWLLLDLQLDFRKPGCKHGEHMDSRLSIENTWTLHLASIKGNMEEHIDKHIGR